MNQQHNTDTVAPKRLYQGMYHWGQKVRHGWMDASDPDDTAGGCDLCEVEWVGTFYEVQQQFIDHRHNPLRELRYVIDALGPSALAAYGFLVEQVWAMANQATHNDGSGSDDVADGIVRDEEN